MDSSGFGDPGKRVGRKKAAEKKNKQPRRGKGVASLELEIWKENLKNLPPNYSAFHPVMKLHGHSYFPSPSFPDPVPTTIPGTIPLFGGFIPDSHAPIPTTVPGFLLRGFENNGQVVDSGSAGEGFSGKFQGDPFGIGAPTPMLWGGMAEEPSKEVTSTPNLGAFSDRCGLCHKKRDTSKRENEEHLDTSKEVEVVAVRRKGMDGSGVVMEYEFFPARRGGGSGGGGYNRVEKMKSEASPTSSSCVTTNASGSGSGGGGGYDSMELSNSVDLSLKLSL